jgi:hypothetical protein
LEPVASSRQPLKQFRAEGSFDRIERCAVMVPKHRRCTHAAVIRAPMTDRRGRSIRSRRCTMAISSSGPHQPEVEPDPDCS